MIPKLAMFYWTGPELPWLRAQSIASFVRLHPGWDVVLASPERREPPAGARLVLDDVTNSKLPPAARSDSFRWSWLAEHGGFYADTDVVFVRPVDPLFAGDADAWLTTDLGTPVESAGLVRNRHRIPVRDALGRVRFSVALSIGVLGAARGSEFFRRARDLAFAGEPSPDYQSHGTSLLAARWGELTRGVSIGKLPGAAFYRDGSSNWIVRRLWSEDGEAFPAGEHGVHWYGGSPESAPYLGARSPEDLPACWVRRAVTLSRRLA